MGHLCHCPLLIPTKNLLSVTQFCGSSLLECMTSSYIRVMVVALSVAGPRYFVHALLSRSNQQSIMAYHLCNTSCTVNFPPSQLMTGSRLSFWMKYRDSVISINHRADALAPSSPVSVGKVTHLALRALPQLSSIQGSPVCSHISLTRS